MSRYLTLPATLSIMLTGLLPLLATAQTSNYSSSYSSSNSSSSSSFNGSPTMSRTSGSTGNRVAFNRVSLPQALTTCAQLSSEELSITAAAQKVAQEHRELVSVNLSDAGPLEMFAVVVKGSGLFVEKFDGGLRIATEEERGMPAETTSLTNFNLELALKRPIQAQFYYVPVPTALSIIKAQAGIHVACPPGYDEFSFNPQLVSVVSDNGTVEALLESIAAQIGGTLCVTEGRVAIEIKRVL